MNKGLKKLIAYLLGILGASILKIFPWTAPILNDNNFMTIIITSNVLFVGANIAEHAIANKDLPPVEEDKDEGVIKIGDNTLSNIERKLMAFLTTFTLLITLVFLNKLGQDTFTYCFLANIVLFTTGNIISDHLIDGVKPKVLDLFSNITRE
jgi:hypothetical protein